ncbi:aspartokinase, partial [Haematococcus lacustris]
MQPAIRTGTMGVRVKNSYNRHDLHSYDGQYGFLATVFKAFRVLKLSVDVVATSEDLAWPASGCLQKARNSDVDVAFSQPLDGLQGGPGDATAGGGLGTAEEGGPGPSHAAAGVGDAPDEGDPVVPSPAAGLAHAGLAGSYGQGVTDPMALTHEGPEVKP